MQWSLVPYYDTASHYKYGNIPNLKRRGHIKVILAHDLEVLAILKGGWKGDAKSFRPLKLVGGMKSFPS